MAAINSTFEFVLHVIPPPRKINWSKPRNLFFSTFINHLFKDKAPIGHLFIEFTVPENAHTIVSPKVSQILAGAKRVVTGMTRKKMTVIESLKVVQGKRLGLGTLYHDFPGKLDAFTDALDEIEWAKKLDRHATIRVQIDEAAANAMVEFLNRWIEHGSFRHYSGGLRVDLGEGAGCAEFGMQFLSMALGSNATHSDWMRRVRVPSGLIGGGFAGNTEKDRARMVNVFNIIKEGHRWAFTSEDHRVYSIPDPELIYEWVKNHVGAETESDGTIAIELKHTEVTWHTGECTPTEFKTSYEKESMGSVQEQWAKICER